MDQEYKKGLVFLNKHFQASEFYQFEELEGKTFDYLAIDLWDRMRRKKTVAFRSDVESPERAAARQSAKFSWLRPGTNTYQTINGARGVLEFVHDTGVREIYFHFDPIGGKRDRLYDRHAAADTPGVDQ